MQCFPRGISSLSLPVLFLTALHAQDPQQPPPPAAKPPAPQAPGTVLETKNWVRLFSAGATLSVLGQPPLGNGSFFQDSATSQLDASTIGGGHRLGFGGLVQIRLPRHYAIAASFVIHRSFHSRNIDSFTGIDNPNTPLDDRIHTTIDEESNVRYQDYSLLFRRYGKPHTTSGTRYFVEGGPSFRRIHRISTTRQTTVGATESSDTIPITAQRRVARGLTGGIGVQFVDDFGIRLVPEFRYTRWTQLTFDGRSTRSRKNQFEAIVSITF